MIFSVFNSIFPSKGYIREGKSLLALGDYKSALRSFQKAKDLEPANTTIDADVKNDPATY